MQDTEPRPLADGLIMSPATQTSQTEIVSIIDKNDQINEVRHQGNRRQTLTELLKTTCWIHFTDSDLERTYRAYIKREKRTSNIITFILFQLFFNGNILVRVCTSFSMTVLHVLTLIIVVVWLVAGVMLLILIYNKMCGSATLKLLPFATWISATVELCIAFGNQSTPDHMLDWVLILMFLTYIVLPVAVRWCVLFNSVLALLHVSIGIIMTYLVNPPFMQTLGLQIGANMLLFMSANLAGVVNHYMIDRRHRKTFMETKVSLKVKVQIEKESKVQERLLLSVLPRHVADEVLKDMGKQVDTQFRKIYMGRHENVSILFADIVGFTALSSSCTAKDLIKILNDLFARFDKLAKQYHQLRIKILGDCYYCISGAPVPRPDHSVLCIHMGLGMVKTIEVVREKTQSGINMRVGIHTGAVLGGVLGLKQWQYDVLGKEVTLANKMESGGIPGRVHISETTMMALNGEFDLEPGEGEKREEALKLAGIKTYLIKSVLKPFTRDMHGALAADEDKLKRSASLVSSVGNDFKAIDDNEALNRKLYQELTERGDDTNIFRYLNAVTMMFHRNDLEARFMRCKDRQLGVASIVSLIIVFFNLLSRLCILTRKPLDFIPSVVSMLVLIVLAAVIVAPVFPMHYPSTIVRIGQNIETRNILRLIVLTLTSLIIMAPDIISMVSCGGVTSDNRTITITTASEICLHPGYFIHFTTMSLLGIIVFVQLSYLSRAIIAIITTVIICIISNTVRHLVFDYYDSKFYSTNSNRIHLKHATVVTLVFISLTIIALYRHSETLARKLFMWKQEVEEQNQQITTMRQKSEQLVNNILPSHVAKDFLGRDRQDEELYSQSHEEVGVMFAACPNFNDFYTEDNINNNGLECLRFLNEIISDYDEICNQSKFETITKIKTVGSTYMAASGMTLNLNDKTASKRKWSHLADLIEFALAMKDALDKINAQSFNNFILKIGLNHGPIIAGVIGARKPHYDIWGNTVNVASRMESTGKAGHIQVVEETMNILELFGYTFMRRGLVKVKGKGDLMTYFLTGKQPCEHNDLNNDLPNQVMAA